MSRRTIGGSLVAMWILAVVVVATGCTASSAYMKPVQKPTAVSPPGGKALIYFVRPSSFANAICFTIIDDKGNFIGDSTPYSRFATLVDPGEHRFIAWAENTAAMKANVEAGKTYWVQVIARMGFWVARVALYAVRRDTDMWQEIESYKNDTELFEVNVAAGQANLNADKPALDEAVKEGIETWNGYSPEDKKDATLRPEDGI